MCIRDSPNSKGAKAYAKCVQSKIDQLEADGGESEWMVRTTSDERDIVLVLDASGSMAGAPMKETKKASANFIRTVLKAVSYTHLEEECRHRAAGALSLFPLHYGEHPYHRSG